MNAAVIGLGFVGKAHVEALRRLPIHIAGALGSPGRTDDACAALGLRAYRSLEELVADPAVDVVHVCTPNHVHFPQTKAALEGSKHVLCEKPLAMTAAEARQLEALARAARRVGAVAYNLRYYPLCIEARARVQSGEIGEPKLVYGGFIQDWLLEPSDWNWRLVPELGGETRAVSDIGTHWLDLMSWITGHRVTDLCADLATTVPIRQRPLGHVQTFQRAGEGEFEQVPIRTDDYASILLRYEGGLHGVVTVSQVSAGRKNHLWFEIAGSKASLAWDGENPNVLWIGHRHEPNGLLIKNPALMSPQACGFTAYPAGHAEGYPDTFVQLFKDFYAYLGRGHLDEPRPFPTFREGSKALALCDAVLLSAKERRWVTLPNE